MVSPVVDVSLESLASTSLTEFALVNEEGSLYAVPYSSYVPSYGVGTTYNSLFSGFVYKLSPIQHYVYFRPDQYRYIFAYGDSLRNNDSIFTGTDIHVVVYNTNFPTGGQPSLTSHVEDSFLLSASSNLVYSDIGDYPALVDRRSSDYSQASCVILASFLLLFIFFRIRSSFSLH